MLLVLVLLAFLYRTAIETIIQTLQFSISFMELQKFLYQPCDYLKICHGNEINITLKIGYITQMIQHSRKFQIINNRLHD